MRTGGFYSLIEWLGKYHEGEAMRKYRQCRRQKVGHLSSAASEGERHQWDQWNLTRMNEAPRSLLRGITELNSEDFSEAEANPVASYGECSSS